MPIVAPLSAGIATFPANGATVEEFFQAADSALYQAKDDGRNRVQLAAAQEFAHRRQIAETVPILATLSATGEHPETFHKTLLKLMAIKLDECNA